MTAPAISVVVPTYNRLDRLRRVLRAVADQTRPVEEIELIVVSDGSTDGTDEYLVSDEVPRPVIALFQQNAGPAAARNAGLQRASADVVLFLDDDVIPEPSLIDEHLRAHERTPGAVVIGPMLTPADHEMSPWVRWEQTMLYKQYDALAAGRYQATARQFYTGNASIERWQLQRFGGFDEAFRRAEDIELAYRLADEGIEFDYVGEARGFHYAERSFASWSDIAYQYGRNDVVFARYPGRERLGRFLAWTFSQHRKPLQWVIWAAVASSWVSAVVVGSMRGVVEVTERLRLTRVSRAALSVIYGVVYHRGMADELGGADRFRHMMRTGDVGTAIDAADVSAA